MKITEIRKGDMEMVIGCGKDTEHYEEGSEDFGVTTFICFHNRYNLGNFSDDVDHSDFSGWDDLKEYLVKTYKPVYICPLYLYDHSGITIADTPFGCQWDSGQLGFMMITKEKIREMYAVKNVTKKIIARAVKEAKSILKSYDNYLQGNIYYYSISEITKCKECGVESEFQIDNCGGFIADDWESAMPDMIENMAGDVDEEFIEHLKKTFIKEEENNKNG